MTLKEFKELKPEFASLEGDELWNAMEDYMLRQQSGQEVMKSAVPFFKRYQLRWLFYRKVPNWKFEKNNHTSAERCSACKKGASGSFGMIFMGKLSIFCPHCNKELIKEPNTNINHRIWKIWDKSAYWFWKIMDKIHLVRSSHEGRYGMFSDECKYVGKYFINMDTGKTTFELKKRKWWEHIFIERKSFNF